MAKGLHVDYVGFGLVAIGLGTLQIVLDKGQRDDWFESNFIVSLSAIPAVALVALVVWELTRRDPIVDLPLLKNTRLRRRQRRDVRCRFRPLRHHPIAAADGAGRAGLHGHLGRTGDHARRIRRHGNDAGRRLLLGKVSARKPDRLGLVIEAVALFGMSGLNADVAFHNVAMGARVYRPPASPFCSCRRRPWPMSALPPGKNNNASALINLGATWGAASESRWRRHG